jgi:hypothetical protein
MFVFSTVGAPWMFRFPCFARDPMSRVGYEHRFPEAAELAIKASNTRLGEGVGLFVPPCQPRKLINGQKVKRDVGYASDVCDRAIDLGKLTTDGASGVGVSRHAFHIDAHWASTSTPSSACVHVLGLEATTCMPMRASLTNSTGPRLRFEPVIPNNPHPAHACMHACM